MDELNCSGFWSHLEIADSVASLTIECGQGGNIVAEGRSFAQRLAALEVGLAVGYDWAANRRFALDLAGSIEWFNQREKGPLSSLLTHPIRQSRQNKTHLARSWTESSSRPVVCG